MSRESREPEITTLLSAWQSGDQGAGDRLFDRVYGELRRLAAIQLRGQRGGVTLAPTVLVHEAYLKLDSSRSLSVRDRGHFYCLAARAMRQIVVDHARRRHAVKRNAGLRPLTLDPGLVGIEDSVEEMLALDEALSRLGELDPDLARVVELRFFIGLSVEEAGQAIDRSARTVKRQWRLARAFLFQQLAPELGPQGPESQRGPG